MHDQKNIKFCDNQFCVFHSEKEIITTVELLHKQMK